MNRLTRNLWSIFALISSLFIATSCGDDSTEDAPTGMQATIVTRSSSIKEGTEVDAATVTKITISYNTTVTQLADANITLNGVKVVGQKGATTAMDMDIAVTLEDGKEYTLIIPEGSVVATNDANRTAPEFVLHFKTKKSLEDSLPDNDAMAVTRMLGFGWNLGNHFDSHNDGKKVPESWGSWWDHATPTEALYQNLAKAGVKTVRIPVTWGPWQGAAPEYLIEDSYMSLVKNNVLWAKAAGLNVVLNTHHDEYWQDAYSASSNTETNEEIKARIVATWKQIAETFKDEDDYLILETFNELNHSWAAPTNGELKIMNEWNQLVVNTIRETGGKNATRWIAVPSYQASPTYALDSRFVIPADNANKLIVAVHCYDPYNFTLAENLGETWGHKTGNSYDEKNITELLSKLKAQFIEKNIPCYLGEIGCSRHTTDLGNACRDYYLEYFCRAAHYAGLAVTLWDNFSPGDGAEHHAYISHNDGSWMNDSEELVKTMIKAATSTDPTYTLESIYNRAPSK